MSERTTAQELDELVRAAAAAADGVWTTTVLAAAVLDLEQTAGAPLGDTGADPTVVLQRRLGRAHRLLARDAEAVDPDRVRRHRQALVGPAPQPAVDVPAPVDACRTR